MTTTPRAAGHVKCMKLVNPRAGAHVKLHEFCQLQGRGTQKTCMKSATPGLGCINNAFILSTPGPGDTSNRGGTRKNGPGPRGRVKMHELCARATRIWSGFAAVFIKKSRLENARCCYWTANFFRFFSHLPNDFPIGSPNWHMSSNRN